MNDAVDRLVDKYLSRFNTYRTRLISYYFFYLKGVSILFEIGQRLKEARVGSGVTLLEASRDLNIKDIILENIEEGSMGCFKDIFELKDYIINYAKYLGLDANVFVDDFNEYLFEYTSKIPLKEIEKKVMEQNKEKQEEKVVSPYTKPMRKYPTKYYILLYTLLIALAIVVVVWSVNQISQAHFN